MIFHRLGPEGYGRWALIFTIGGWFLFVDLGIHLGITRFAGQFAGAGDRSGLHRLFQTAAYACAGLFVLAALLAVGLSHPLLGRFLDRHTHPSDDAALIFLCVFHVLTAAIRTTAGIYAGLQKIDTASVISMLIGLLQGAGIWRWYMSETPTLERLAMIFLAAAAIHLIALIFLLMRTPIGTGWMPVTDGSSGLDAGLLKSLLSFGFILYVSRILVAVLTSDRLYLGWIRAPLDQIAAYHIGALMVTKAAVVLNVIWFPVYPAAAALAACRDDRRIEELSLKTFRILAAVGFFLFAFLDVFARPLVFVWLGMDSPVAVQTARLLSGWGLTAIFGGLGAIAIGVGRADIQFKSCGVAAAAMLALYPILIRPFGAAGVAAAISLAFMASGLCLLAWFRRDVVRIPVKTLLWDGIIRPIGCATVAVGAAWTVSRIFGGGDRIHQAVIVLGAGILALVIYAVSARVAGLIRDDDLAWIRRS